MTGDRLDTAVLVGLGVGMAAALTPTDAKSTEVLAAPDIQPTHVIRRLGGLLPAGV